MAADTLRLDDDDEPTTSRWEVGAWYLYYVGANGLALFNFGPTAVQSLLEQAAAADPAGDGLLAFAGRRRDVNSIVLLANGISFAGQAALFVAIGAYADFSPPLRRAVLLLWSCVAFGVGFAWLGVHEPERWRAGVGLYIVGLVAYQLTLTYWTAAFPVLARASARVKAARRAAAAAAAAADGPGADGPGADGRPGPGAGAAGTDPRAELTRCDELERSRLSNVAFWAQSVGEVLMLGAIVGIMLAIRVDGGGAARNSWGLSVLIAFATACWLALSIPWFALEKRRPGRPRPPGVGLAGAGLWQLRTAAAQLGQLRQSLVYLAGYFLLGDALNTTVTVVATLQNQVVQYRTLTLTYLLLVGVGAQAAGIGAFWLVQRRFGVGAKAMFTAVMVAIVGLDAWGMVGNWTVAFGFHHEWEVWLYQALYGLFVCPWYSYSQIIISSVTPPGHEFLFFSLFNIVGKASSFVGPFISSAIIDASTGPNRASSPFYFLFALSLVSAAGLWLFLDLDESAREQEAFLAREEARRSKEADGMRQQVP